MWTSQTLNYIQIEEHIQKLELSTLQLIQQALKMLHFNIIFV